MRNLMKKKIAAAILFLLVFCGFLMVAQPALPVCADTVSSLSDSESLEDRLAALEGVTSVTQKSASYGYQQVYELTFRQPVSYDDPGAGTFEQHAILYYSGDENVTCVNTEGYSLRYPYSSLSLRPNYKPSNANIIDIEYRFYGSSVPEGLSEDSTALWNYLNSENAAMDFHRIVQSLSAIFTGKRVWTGCSKGGYTTNYQCYFQEKHGFHDADAFVAWVAPLCDGTEDMRVSYAIQNTIGDEVYGEETAQKYRDLVLKIQLEFVRYREQLQTRYYNAAIEKGYKFREAFFTSDPETAAARLWDASISEFAILKWQYYLKWDRMENILNTTDETEKIDALYNMMIDFVGLGNEAYNDGYLPYFIQAACEMGNYKIDLSYLRTAIKKEQESDPDFPNLVLPESLEGSCSLMYFTEEQREAFTYSGEVHDALLNWAKNTTSNCIMIQGLSDPYNFVGLPVTDNPYVHRYFGKYNHSVHMFSLTEEEQTEIWGLLEKWLAPDPEPEPQPQPVKPDQSDSNVKESTEYFMAKGTTVSKTSQKITWAKVTGAQSYKVYRGRCGETGCKCIATVSGTKAVSRNLKQKKNYKYYVEAYSGANGTGKKLARTVILHLASKGTKYTNVKKVKVSAGQTSLSVGGSTKINVKLIKQDPSKSLVSKRHCANVRYRSLNTNVAVVDAKGKVTAKAKGQAYIDAIAPNGVSARVLISVN